MSTAIETARLGDQTVAEVILGQSPPSTTYNEQREGLPFYQGKADFGLVHPTPRVWCTQGTKFAKPDDVLMSVRAPVGDVNMATEDAVIGRGVSAIRAADGVDPWFLYFALAFMKPALEAHATGSTFASVNGTTLRDLEIPFVPFEDQVAIGRTLRLLLTQLQGEETALKATAEAKAGAMQRLFSRGLRGDEQKETEIGPVPSSWRVGALGDLAEFQRGFDITKSTQVVTGTVPVVSSGGVRSYHDTAAVEGPGVVLGRKGSIGSTYYVASDFWPHDTTLWCRDFHGNLPKFVFYRVQILDLKRLDSGAANPALNRNFLHAETISWPGVDEQQEIVDVLDALDRKIDLVCRKRDVLDQLFRSLLHELMTGEVSVHDLDLSALPTPEGGAA